MRCTYPPCSPSDFLHHSALQRSAHLQDRSAFGQVVSGFNRHHKEKGKKFLTRICFGDRRRLEITHALGTVSVSVPDVAAGDGAERFPSLDLAMKRHIEAALAHCHGRVEGSFGAVQQLKINPHTLRLRMRRLGGSGSAIAAMGGDISPLQRPCMRPRLNTVRRQWLPSMIIGELEWTRA